jgi:hypothetical protein
MEFFLSVHTLMCACVGGNDHATERDTLTGGTYIFCVRVVADCVFHIWDWGM